MKAKSIAAVGSAALAAATLTHAQASDSNSSFKLNPDGSLTISSFTLPLSTYTSPEARADMEQKFEAVRQLRSPELMAQAASAPNPFAVHREASDRVMFIPFAEAQKRHYAVTMTRETIGGVDVQVFDPKDGISAANKKRVLINLHGGGFLLGWPYASQIESIPMAAVARIKVVSVNYGKFPEAKFPRASEDVAAVYRALLKQYKPSQIGLYGCSAGGILASEAIAWFQKEKLPSPAAIAILSASLDPSFQGDSAYITPHFGSLLQAPIGGKTPFPYFTGADVNDPLVSPSHSPAILAKFPPTLLATGTRAGDMSATTRSHLDLLKAGVDAQLALWDGLDHCFLYNPDLPESRDAYALIAKFFDTKMSAAGK
jgi:acetyl esterase/lipase